MTEVPNTNEDKRESGSSPDEFRLIPNTSLPTTTNTTNGSQYGLQAGAVTGGVTINNGTATMPDLLFSLATADEIEDARLQFVPPGEFHAAQRMVGAHSVAVLCGRGSGRSFTARRLLIDCGIDHVIDLNPDRTMRSVCDIELRPGAGYIWDMGQSGDTPFTERDFDRFAGLTKIAGCKFVLVLDNKAQAPGTVTSYAVTLTPPDPVEVALAIIQRNCPGAAEAPAMVLKSNLAQALNEGDPPGKAALAGRLAIKVSNGELDVPSALADLDDDANTAVARWFKGLGVIEYAKSLAVALLENQPYDEVVRHALELDVQVRRAELPEDKKLRPRRVFDKPKAKLLRDIRAVTVTRDHPKHLGLEEETVRFERQDWAAAVFRHAWSEYPAIHTVLRDWMCGPEMLDRFADATRRALCRIIAEVPAHDPLRLVDHLASRPRMAHRRLAASALEHLADDHNLLPLVRQTLETWADQGTAYRQWTAAIVYGSPFGRRDTPHALVQLAKIGRSNKSLPQNAVVEGVLTMLTDPDHRDHVLDNVVAWSNGQNRYNGLRPVSLSLAMWIIGFFRATELDGIDFGELYRPQVNILVRRVLADPEFSSYAISRLHDLATQMWDRRAAIELVRLATLITPDLRWWRRRRIVGSLVAQHPTRRTTIQLAFRAARKAQRAGARS